MDLKQSLDDIIKELTKLGVSKDVLDLDNEDAEYDRVCILENANSKEAKLLTKAFQIMESFVVDSVTGAVVNVFNPEDGDGIENRSDLYWKNPDQLTNRGPLEPTTLSKEQRDGICDRIPNSLVAMKRRAEKAAKENTPTIIVIEGEQMKRTLFENELMKSRDVAAAQYLVTDLQNMAEKISKLKVDSLSPLSDELKNSFGVDKSSAFNRTATQSLEEALNAVLKAKDDLSTAILRLTGDVETDMEKEMSSDDMADFDVPSDDKILKPERPMKESVAVEFTKKNKTHTMIFENAIHAKKWLSNNKVNVTNVIFGSK